MTSARRPSTDAVLIFRTLLQVNYPHDTTVTMATVPLLGPEFVGCPDEDGELFEDCTLTE